ncbi:MAG: DNA-deoxyinosine glycosylase [bacterium]
MAQTEGGELLYGFPPIIGERPRVLILGSMPSVKSLELGQYYGHPRNHFWDIVFRILAEPVPRDYEQRVRELKRAGIAVWDAIGSCRREGSLDQSIKDEVPNDVVGLLRKFSGIRLVVFNGRKAEQGFYRGLKELYGYHARERVPELNSRDFIRLPSSSPIPTRQHKRWQDKLAEWRIILKYLQD